MEIRDSEWKLVSATVREVAREECETLPPYVPVQLKLPVRVEQRVPKHASPAVVKSDYLAPVMSPITLQKVVRKACAVIKKTGIEFDAIAFRGFSGALVAPMVACRLRKGFLAVRKRKENEDCHSSHSVEGAVRADCNYIIIDDLISSGATIWHIVNELNEYTYEDYNAEAQNTITHRHTRKCVGVFLYNTWADDDDPSPDWREIHNPECDHKPNFYVSVYRFKGLKS